MRWHAGKNKAIVDEFPEHNLITAIYSGMPCSNLFLSSSGVTIGRCGGAAAAAGRKCDPAALGCCVALCLPPGDPLCVTVRTSVTAPHSTQNNFCCFFCFDCLWPFLSETKEQPSVWHFCRCCFGNSAPGQRRVFFTGRRRHYESVLQLVFTDIWVWVLKASGYKF